jgi:hypothetical protein
VAPVSTGDVAEIQPHGPHPSLQGEQSVEPVAASEQPRLGGPEPAMFTVLVALAAVGLVCASVVRRRGAGTWPYCECSG